MRQFRQIQLNRPNGVTIEKMAEVLENFLHIS